ncbi:MAG: 3-dehydroquinate synthase [Salinivirgaceae bacterium]|jgi:3-dehydroquinate synthase
MQKLIIHGSSSDSQLLVGENFENFRNYLPANKQIIVLTDDKVNSIYGNSFNGFPTIVIGQTEKVKTLETIDAITEQLIAYKADRGSFLLAVGGGIVCDIGGFVASVYQRGIRFGFISTTLLSQVDASVGGKNGVNHRGFKNMVGVFNQPDFVICDPNMLKTLSSDDLSCGFAEIVKHTLIADANMFEWLEQNTDKATGLELEAIEKLVFNSVAIKAAIVNKDEKEQGERRKLNLGHTYGHAVEKVMHLSHGKAVSLGLVVAAKLSVKRGLLDKPSYDRIVTLLQKLNLPVEINGNKQEILDALTMDKKREGNSIHFILMKGIGEVVVESIGIDELKQVSL